MPDVTGVIALNRWKVTLPTGKRGDPTELAGDELVRHSSAWFRRTVDGGLAFAAPVTGVTTPGSKNPRSELRELDGKGGRARWQANDGKAHVLSFTEAFIELPRGKPHVVGAQIHDSKDDVSVFRLEGTKLWVTKGNDLWKIADPAYVLGAKFTGRFVVYRGKIQAWYNGRLVGEFETKGKDFYFKIGAYVQANPESLKDSKLVVESNIGEVVVYSATVEHGADAPPAPGQPAPAPEQAEPAAPAGIDPGAWKKLLDWIKSTFAPRK